MPHIACYSHTPLYVQHPATRHVRMNPWPQVGLAYSCQHVRLYCPCHNLCPRALASWGCTVVADTTAHAVRTWTAMLAKWSPCMCDCIDPCHHFIPVVVHGEVAIIVILVVITTSRCTRAGPMLLTRVKQTDTHAGRGGVGKHRVPGRVRLGYIRYAWAGISRVVCASQGVVAG